MDRHVSPRNTKLLNRPARAIAFVEWWVCVQRFVTFHTSRKLVGSESMGSENVQHEDQVATSGDISTSFVKYKSAIVCIQINKKVKSAHFSESNQFKQEKSDPLRKKKTSWINGQSSFLFFSTLQKQKNGSPQMYRWQSFLMARRPRSPQPTSCFQMSADVVPF